MFGLSKRYDAEKMAWIRLARTEGIGPIRMARLIDRFSSAEKAVEAFPTIQALKKYNLPSLSKIEDEIFDAHHHGATHICMYEDAYPESLRMIADPPPVLTVRGDISLLHKRSVGIVGTRNASLNGKKMTAKLAQEISQEDYVIVSGMARGIDTAAHEATLRAGQKTIAVLAGGVDHIYPKENKTLYEDILKHGAIISEYAWGMKPNAKLFPQRNRIVSGLSLGLIVVEAAVRSGSLITARLAAEQGREVFAVPGFPMDSRSSGPNSLIKQGAKIVCEALDVLDDIANMAPRPVRLTKFREQDDVETLDMLFDETPEDIIVGNQASESADIIDLQNSKQDNLSLSLQDQLLIHLSTTPIGIDDLIRVLEQPASVVQSTLIMLELEQKVERLHGNRVALCA